MHDLWSKDAEFNFFQSALKMANPGSLFYRMTDGRFVAYYPKEYEEEKETIQSRNSLVGSYTERWVIDLLKDVATDFGLFAVGKVVCDEIGLDSRSPADVAFCTSDRRIQEPNNIKLVVEVKMSIVWNWELLGQEVKPIGDYTTHSGNPGLLRSDTMLKAIGKSLNLRVANVASSEVPIIILGNTPITKFYYKKVDFLNSAGIIQKFISVNPNPLDNESSLKMTPEGGYEKVDSYEELKSIITPLISEERKFFSGMKSVSHLGRIIEIANKEDTYEKKAQTFIRLIRCGELHE